MEIRKLTEKDREANRKLMRYAFETSKNTYENLESPIQLPMNWSYGAFDEEKLVATASYIPFQIRMRSNDFRMSGVAGVATKPEYRNRGIIRDIMVKMFKDMHDNKVPISVLYPFKISFYEMLGYKVVDECIDYHFKISDILYKETDYHMIEVDEINDDIREVYDKAILNFDYIAKRPMIDYWQSLYKGNYKFICYNGNQPVGYIIITFLKKNEHWIEYPERTIFIREVFWLDQNAKQTLFNFLWNHRDQREYILGAFPIKENIIDLLRTPRIQLRSIRANSLLRIIYVKAVLENLEYPISDFSISFHIDDEFCPWNDGFFSLTSKEKEITVDFNDVSKNSVDIEIDIGHFAQLVAGFRTVGDLLEFGFITVNHEKLELLEKLFPKTNNYLHDFF
ncbi:MAG: enhanced intracellular survival protein Eis [Candidatus Hodarchaeota archaeon]